MRPDQCFVFLRFRLCRTLILLLKCLRLSGFTTVHANPGFRLYSNITISRFFAVVEYICWDAIFLSKKRRPFIVFFVSFAMHQIMFFEENIRLKHIFVSVIEIEMNCMVICFGIAIASMEEGECWVWWGSCTGFPSVPRQRTRVPALLNCACSAPRPVNDLCELAWATSSRGKANFPDPCLVSLETYETTVAVTMPEHTHTNERTKYIW